MTYVIVTVAWCTDKGISIPAHAKTNSDRSKIILHKEYIAPVLLKEDEIIEYTYDSIELKEILSNQEWCNNE